MAEFVDEDKMLELRDMLDDLMDLESKLSPGEREKIESLSHWTGCFTVSQAEMLQQIYNDRITAE